MVNESGLTALDGYVAWRRTFAGKPEESRRN